MAEAYQGIGSNSGAIPLAERLPEDYAKHATEIEALAARANKLPAEIKNEEQLGEVGKVVKDAATLINKIEFDREIEVRPHLTGQREVNAFFKIFTDRLDRMRSVLAQRGTDYTRKKVNEERIAREDAARKAREEEDKKRETARKAEEANRPAAAAKATAAADNAAETARRNEAEAAAPAATFARTSFGGVTASAKTEWTFKITDYDAIPLEKLRAWISRAEVEKAIRALIKRDKKGASLPGVEFFEDVKASFR